MKDEMGNPVPLVLISIMIGTPIVLILYYCVMGMAKLF